MCDIYFDPLYGKTTENIEKGLSKTFKYNDDLGTINHMFIKREIPNKIDGITYFDLITPYGYGGPIIIKCKDERLISKLVDNFHNSFKSYCISNNIISEFIRFHPIFENHKYFENIYEVEYIRNTVGTNLVDFEDPFMAEFSATPRKLVRRAIKNGVTCKITEAPKDLEIFKEIYFSTMDRNDASEFYYFGDDYFNDLLKNISNNLVLCEAIYEDKVIAVELFLKYDSLLHSHLGGTLSDYLYLSPVYVIKYGISMWGKENKYKLVHHGGGKTNSKNDNLYMFKKRFANNTEFKFYIGKKIWDIEKYNELCKLVGKNKNNNYFPLYRK